MSGCFARSIILKNQIRFYRSHLGSLLELQQRRTFTNCRAKRYVFLPNLLLTTESHYLRTKAGAFRDLLGQAARPGLADIS